MIAQRSGLSQPLPSHRTPDRDRDDGARPQGRPEDVGSLGRPGRSRSGIRPRTTNRATAAAIGATTNPGHWAPGMTGEQDRHHREGAARRPRTRGRSRSRARRRGRRARPRPARPGPSSAEAAAPTRRAAMNTGPARDRSPTEPVTTSVARPADDEGPRAPEVADRAADEQQDRRRDGAEEHVRLEARALADGRLHGRQRGAPDLGVETRGEQRERARQERRPRLPIVEDVGEDLGQRRSRHTARCYRRRGRSRPAAHEARPGRTEPGLGRSSAS